VKNGPLIHSDFSRKYYDKMFRGTEVDTTWRGVCLIKCPMDLQSYQEIIYKTKPELIIETGAFLGGSAVFMADLLELFVGGDSRVLSIDLNRERELPEHPRVDFLVGASSTDPSVLEHAKGMADGRRTMVVLDSAHNRRHVLEELRLYAPLVTKGCYLIVEDTNVDGYYLGKGDIGADGGPAEAVKEWQPSNKGFEVDRTYERFMMSQNPGGYLKRVR